MVTVTATDATGRRDSDMGVVSTKNLAGENLANAILKAITKAKRRVTLSICGLGMLDETEVADIPESSKRQPVAMPRSTRQVDAVTGEVIEQGVGSAVPAPGSATPVETGGAGSEGLARTEAQPAPPQTDEPAWALEDLRDLLAEKTLTIKDLVPQLGPVTKDNYPLAVTAWLIANPGKTVRDLVAGAVPEPNEQGAQV
jgi:hypothetical protein